jgi:hypothetical protein
MDYADSEGQRSFGKVIANAIPKYAWKAGQNQVFVTIVSQQA